MKWKSVSKTQGKVVVQFSHSCNASASTFFVSSIPYTTSSPSFRFSRVWRLGWRVWSALPCPVSVDRLVSNIKFVRLKIYLASGTIHGWVLRFASICCLHTVIVYNLFYTENVFAFLHTTRPCSWCLMLSMLSLIATNFNKNSTLRYLSREKIETKKCPHV